MTVAAPIEGAGPFGLKLAAHLRLAPCLGVTGQALQPRMVTVRARVALETLVFQPEAAILDLLVVGLVVVLGLRLVLRCLGLHHGVPLGELLPHLRRHLHTGPTPLGRVVVLTHELLVLREALLVRLGRVVVLTHELLVLHEALLVRLGRVVVLTHELLVLREALLVRLGRVVLTHALLVLHEALLIRLWLWDVWALVRRALKRLCRHGGERLYRHGTRHAVRRHVLKLLVVLSMVTSQLG